MITARTRRTTTSAMGVAIALSAMAGTANAAPAASYYVAAASDFRPSPYQSNPSSDAYGHGNVWSYKAATNITNQANFATMTNFTSAIGGYAGINGWRGTYADGSGYLPEVTYNATGSTVTIGSVTWYAGDLYMHPSPTQSAVVGWRSPIKGTVCMFVMTSDGDSHGGDGVMVHLSKGNTVLTSETQVNGGTTYQTWKLSVVPGTNLYVSVDANPYGGGGNYAFDNTDVIYDVYRC